MKETTPKSYVIVLDDDSLIHKIVGRILGVNALPFVSGKALLAKAASFHPMAVFVDVHLKEESGLEVLTDLRKIWSRVPILVITADSDSDLIGKALSLGANDFIRKPFDHQELKSRTHALLAEVRQRLQESTQQYHDILCDRERRSFEGPKGRRFLSQSEWLLWEEVLQTPNITVSKSSLKAKVWGNLAVNDGTVNKKISSLRLAIRDVSDGVSLTALYGKGIRLSVKGT